MTPAFTESMTEGRRAVSLLSVSYLVTRFGPPLCRKHPKVGAQSDGATYTLDAIAATFASSRLKDARPCRGASCQPGGQRRPSWTRRRPASLPSDRRSAPPPICAHGARPSQPARPVYPRASDASAAAAAAAAGADRPGVALGIGQAADGKPPPASGERLRAAVGSSPAPLQQQQQQRRRQRRPSSGD